MMGLTWQQVVTLGIVVAGAVTAGALLDSGAREAVLGVLTAAGGWMLGRMKAPGHVEVESD